ncbi:hypothetical protein SUDANB58_00416 [Streptomyces sp. enrichment culture]|uniref:DUF190 domain-containing protein n=1 Tax=Streptomyces sp. enrichment culture TaxID=1795815 RepID=UPI003F57791F
MTGPTGSAPRLIVPAGGNGTRHHRPLPPETVHRARAAGPADAGVLRGVEGFGASRLVHTTRPLPLGEDLPAAVVIIDAEDRVRAFPPRLDEPVTEDPVVPDDREAVGYAGREDASGGAPGAVRREGGGPL